MTQRILQLVASSHGGAATHVRDLAFGLPRDRYHNIVAMPLDGGNVTPAMFTAQGIEFVPVAITNGFKWRELRQLQALIQEKNIDLIHAHGARAALFGRLAVLGLRPRPRLVFSIHGFATPFHPTPKRQLYLWLERTLQGVTDCTIAVAQAEADLFLSFGLTTPDKMRVITYGIDVERFASSPPDLTALREELRLGIGPILLTVCRLNIPRDFKSLLIALQRVQVEFPTVKLLIVGDGPQRAEVEQLITLLGLNETVQITGFRDDIPDLMALADVYVLTSYGWEGYPISTMEAQAAGVPVVVTDAGGSKEAVLHEQTGLVVSKQNSDALAVALWKFLGDRDMRQRFGKAGQLRAREEFTVAQMVAKIRQVYG